MDVNAKINEPEDDMERKEELTEQERAAHSELKRQADDLVFGGRDVKIPETDLSSPCNLDTVIELIRSTVDRIEGADEPDEVCRVALVEMLHDVLFRVQTGAEAMWELNATVEHHIRSNAKRGEKCETFRRRTEKAEDEAYVAMVRGRLAAVENEALATGRA